MRPWPGIRISLAALPLGWLAASPGCRPDKPVFSHPLLRADRSVTRTTRQLTVALESENPDQRRKALLTLTDEPAARSPEALRALDLIARTDREVSVRRAAVAVLAAYTDGRPVECLLKLLHAEDHPRAVRPTNSALRWDVVTALGRLAARSAIPDEEQARVVRSLAELLYGETEHYVRISAARALRHFYSRRSVRALIDALSDRDFGVAFEARASLRYLTGIEEDLPLAVWQEWLTQAYFQEDVPTPATEPPPPAPAGKVPEEP